MAQPVVANPLEPLYEGWQRGLAIVAHPVDLEFGAAAAIARWTGQGKQIVYCLVTSAHPTARSVSTVISGGIPRRKGSPSVPSPGFTYRKAYV